jgi:hypothetical protein
MLKVKILGVYVEKEKGEGSCISEIYAKPLITQTETLGSYVYRIICPKEVPFNPGDVVHLSLKHKCIID